MTDLATLKEDLNCMKSYRRWIKAIANNSEKDLSAECYPGFKIFIDHTIAVLDGMIRKYGSFIETMEGVYEETEE